MVRAMSRDPSVWEKPEQFIPERHLSKEGPFEHINSVLAYGFGRRCVPFAVSKCSMNSFLHSKYRICVGRWMANDLLFISIAMILATVNISGPAADNSKMDVEDQYSEHGFWYVLFESMMGNSTNLYSLLLIALPNF
jgi:hypothetical protein